MSAVVDVGAQFERLLGTCVMHVDWTEKCGKPAEYCKEHFLNERTYWQTKLEKANETIEALRVQVADLETQVTDLLEERIT